MMRFLVLLSFVFGTAAAANPPFTSLRPVTRPVVQSAADPQPTSQPAARERRGLLGLLRPNSRPPSERRLSRKERRARAKGGVCGDVDIQGVEIGTVPAKLVGCGVENAVRVSAISGITLSQKSVMDCTTAKALKTWIEDGMRPSVKRRGGGVVSIRVAAHYACRTRNNKPGAKISEHGRGRAIDIAAFTLRNGSTISVLDGWGKRRDGKVLRRMHKAACGPFGTVLGPDADRYHRDHFHFDTARYRSGSYCK
ncbi:MAG: extensin family protein [Rhodobacterales bacterium]|nr:extensin family protein [Rhodobacterales bacterium]